MNYLLLLPIIDDCKKMILEMIKGLDMELIEFEGKYNDSEGWRNIGIRLYLKNRAPVNIVIEEDQRAQGYEKLVFGIKSDRYAKNVLPYNFTDKDGGPFIRKTKRDGYTWLLYRSLDITQLGDFKKFIELCIANLRGQ